MLRTGRTAAFLTLASGINGTAAAMLHGWDGRWLYVATVGVIAALDGWLIGIVAAVGAVACYQLMSFGRLDLAPDRDAVLLAAAIVVAIAARAMRVTIARPRLPAPKTPPLLTGITAVPVEVRPERDIAAAVSEATQALRNALEQERAHVERERDLRLESEQRSRAMVDEIMAELQASKSSLDELQRRHDGLQRSFDELQQIRQTLQADADRSRSAALSAAESVADHERAAEQLRALVRDAEALRDGAEEKARSLERSAAGMQTTLAQAEILERAAAERAAAAEAKNSELRALVDELTVARKAANDRVAELRHSVEEQRSARASELREAADRIAALENDIARLRAAHEQQLYRLDGEWNGRLARHTVELTDRFNAALLEADGRADTARTGAQQLQRELTEARAKAAELRAEIDAEWSEKLEAHIADVSAAYNQAILDAEERTGAALAKAAEMSARVADLEHEQERLRAAADRVAALEQEAAALTAHLAEMRSDNDTLRAQAARADTLQITVTSLAARVHELEQLNEELHAGDETGQLRQHAHELSSRIAVLESEAEMLRLAADRQRSRAEAEWSEKFARSAMEITQRFQGELAAADARANEAEGLAKRLESDAIALDRELVALRESFDTEKAKLESEWNGKLQTIVSHLASDHEADLGQATLEREEARAEARRLAKKLATIDDSVRQMTKAYAELQARDEALLRDADEQKRVAEAQKERDDAEWNARIAANALELTQRFNGAMVAADTRLQQANREAENLASRVRELEGIIANLRAADEQRRAAIDAEWSAKLQTIVDHLASDHEADLGQAVLEKEEARAEARLLSARLGSLQKTLEAEREQQGQSNAEWMSQRANMLHTIESLRAQLRPVTSAGTIPIPAVEGERPFVVVVHRDSAVRAIAKHALESSGYNVATAGDGLEAFRVAVSQKPAVILAETDLPKMGGRELVQMLKSRADTAAVKIVLMSANAESSDRTGEFRADDFLRDPANIEALKATLANVLGARA